jgi:alkylation response protein AidB-like acyl-CoA dehydrogenase
VLQNALQIHGGIGFTWEHDLHFYIKRGKYLESSFGSSTWHRERIGLWLAAARHHG